MDESEERSPARGLVWALPAAAGALVLVEGVRLGALGLEGGGWLGAFGALARGAVAALWPLGLAFGGVALGFCVPTATSPRASAPEARWRAIAANPGIRAAAAGTLLALVARVTLIEHEPFRYAPAAHALVAALALALGAGLYTTLRGGARTRRAIAAVLALLGLLLAGAHQRAFVGLYPSLHAFALAAGFALLVVGLTPLLARRGRLAPSLGGVGIALLALGLVPSSAAEVPAGAFLYTELGRAAALSEARRVDGPHLWPVDLPTSRDAGGPMRPDTEALERFRRDSRLPELPADFDLEGHDVLLVLIDAIAYERTSLALGEGGPTPRLAELAAAGALHFTDARSPSNGTFPSVAAMLSMTPTSLTPLDIRDRHWRGRLRAGRPHVAEALARSGRRTFWVGHDHRRCFTDHILGLERGFEERVLFEAQPGRHADVDREIASRAIEAIEARRGERYFGLVFFGSPHDDYQVHDERAPAGTDLERYAQELAFADRQLGRLIDHLEASGAMDRTVLIVAGDHGEAFGEHGHHFHLSSLHAEQIRVPLVVRVPGLDGATIHAPTSTVYPLPWLLLRAAPPARRAARRVIEDDLGPMLRALDGAVVGEMIAPRRQEVALAWEDWTAHYDLLSGVLRLYDRRRDRHERLDLRESRPDRVAALAPLARRYREARFAGQRFRFVDQRRTRRW